MYSRKQDIIRSGITDLSPINPPSKAKKIRRFIHLLAKHSLPPLETLSSSEKMELSTQGMPTLFPEGQQEWKNAIIQTSDGKIFHFRRCRKKKKGTLVSKKWQSFLMS